MARPLRIEYPGAWYHVMNRGRRKEPIFFSESDYEIFMEVLEETVKMFKIEIHAFALIPNHYHILIRTPVGNISRAMRHINGVYTQKINLEYKMDGSLFRGRFKSILVDKEEYLLELVRYIHRNPYKAGLETNIGKYKWCSHNMYMREENKAEFLIVDEVLKVFSKYKKESRRKLDAFVNEEMPKELYRKLESVKWPAILGGEKFKDKIYKYIKGEEINEREIPEYKKIKVKDQVNDDKLRQFILDNENILKAKRSRKLLNNRKALIYAIKERTRKNNVDIAKMIGDITDAAISKLYRMAFAEVKNKEGCYGEVKKYLRKL